MEKFTGKAFEAFGEWYFTHIPDQPFVGILNFDPESGLELRVVDSMRKQGFGAWKPANRKEERISGISTPWIGLEYRRPQNLEKAMAEISSGARLISVLSGFELSSTVFSLWIQTEEAKVKGHGPVYMLGSTRKAKESDRDRLPMDLLFRFPNISDRFSQIVSGWFVLQNEVPGCMNTFFSANYSTYTNQRMFALTTVLEALHRHFHRNKKYTLKARITECVNDLHSLMKDVVGDTEGFAKKVVQSRNSEAHGNEEETPGNGSEHFPLSSKLRVIIDALILRHLGFSMGEISEAMRKANEYCFMRRMRHGCGMESKLLRRQ